MVKTRDTLRIAARLAGSYANGPGRRAVVWLQGCPFRCPDCFNGGFRDPSAGRDIHVAQLFQWLHLIKGISGVTVSGGEPTEQIPALLPFFRQVKRETDLSILLFSGRTLEQINTMPGGEALISLVDVLVDGPYDPDHANPPGTWPSSANQKIHLLTNRYLTHDFSRLPLQEMIISKDGVIVQSGHTPISLSF